jgi:hypothetical protein
MELRDCYSQAHFSGKQSYATAWKYTDLWSSAVHHEQVPEDGPVGPKHVATDVILM